MKKIKKLAKKLKKLKKKEKKIKKKVKKDKNKVKKDKKKVKKAGGKVSSSKTSTKKAAQSGGSCEKCEKKKGGKKSKKKAAKKVKKALKNILPKGVKINKKKLKKVLKKVAKIDKKEVAAKAKKSADTKQDNLNRDSVLAKTDKAVRLARHAAKMARNIQRDAAADIDELRLRKARGSTMRDVSKMTKLEHQEAMNQEIMAAAKVKAGQAAGYASTAKTADTKSLKTLAGISAKKAALTAGLERYKSIERANKDKSKLAHSTVNDASALLKKDEKYFSKAINSQALSKAGISMGKSTNPAKEARNRARIAKSKVLRAQVLRQTAREALRKAGKPIPANLQKGTLMPTKKKAEAAAIAAAQLNGEHGGSGPITGNNLQHKIRRAVRAEGKQIVAQLKGTFSSVGAVKAKYKRKYKKKMEKKVTAAKLNARPGKTLKKAKQMKATLKAASKKAKKARQALRKAGQPIPSALQKGALKKQKKQVKKMAKKAAKKKEAKKAALPKNMNHKQKAQHVHKKATAAVAKVDKAHALRVKARAWLKKKGKPIPPELQKGGMNIARKRAKKAISLAKAAGGAKVVV